MTKRQRPHGQQQDIRRRIEGDHTRSATDSPADRWSKGYIRRCREGKDEYLYPPGTVETGGQQGNQDSQGNQGSQGRGGGFFSNLLDILSGE